jgi:hypothetical protein
MAAREMSTSVVRWDEAEFRDSEVPIGLVLTRFAPEDGGHLHSGVAFKRLGGFRQVGYLHLKWHHRVGGRWDEPGVWAAPQGRSLEEQDALRVAAVLADQVHQEFAGRRTGIGYGIGWGGSRFVRVPGGGLDLELPPGRHGLTCATLPLSLLRSVGIDLIVESTWPARPDMDADLVAIAKRIGPPEVAAQLESEIERGACRIRPEEVCAAFAASRQPVVFADAVVLGLGVLRVLDETVVGLRATSVRVAEAEAADGAVQEPGA